MANFFKKQGGWILNILIIAAVVFVLGYVVLWKWVLCRVYVAPGEMLVIKANIGKANPDPNNLQVVPPGFKGIYENVLGEGRHFYNPFLYERQIQPGIQEIGNHEVGIVVSRSGKPLAQGQFLTDREQGERGVWRRPLTPGKWRLNPVAYHIQRSSATVIKPGYVGCVTALSPDPKTGKTGILQQVLQPGIYYINPREFRVEEFEVGYRHITLSDVKFKSTDSFDIQVDISVVWGVEPQNVPFIIDTLGNIDQVISKFIQPQVNTIVQLEGSKYKASEFIEGHTREEFQHKFTQRLQEICTEKRINVLIGLVRNIEIPQEVRDPINQSRIADEEGRMKAEMSKTQEIQNQLETLKADVDKGVRETTAQTVKLIAEIQAEGERKVLQLKGQTEVKVAEIMRNVAQIEAEIDLVKGRAQATVTELISTAKADEFTQFAQALGGGLTLARYIFTIHLPQNLSIIMRYAGPGTFWTDLPKNSDVLKRASEAKILSK